MSNILKGLQLNELSNEKLGQYKKAAGADATAADKAGDTKKADKRMSGIVKATKKQFANDEKKEVDEAYNKYQSNRTGFSRGQRDNERHDLDVPGQDPRELRMYNLTIDGKPLNPKPIMGRSNLIKFGKQQAATGVDLSNAIISLVDEGVAEGRYDFSDYHDARLRGDYGMDLPANTSGSTYKELNKGDGAGERGRPQRLKGVSKKLPADPFGRTTGEIPKGKPGTVHSMMRDIDEDELDEACWKGYHKEGNKKMFGKTYPNCVKNEGVAEGWQEESQDLEDWSKEVNKRLYRAHESQRPALARQLSKLEQKNFGSSLNKGSLTELVHSALMAIQKGNMVHYDPQSVGSMPFGNIVGDDARIIAAAGVSSDELVGYRMLSDKGIVDNIKQFLQLRRVVGNKNWPSEYLEKFKGNPGALWLQFVEDLGWSKDDVREAVQAKTDDKLLAYYAQRKAEKEKQQQGVVKEQHNCPHCGGELVSEELMNEKKDACYYKVKSRYKVWPSAYASGALVKCRKKGADSWGNGGKKNESSILEGLEQVDENLNKWFKEKWVRFGPDGKIRGDCARGDDSEGKPKCLPQSKAHSLGKKGRASAAARKRREDPNPERSGKAINVNTKKKANEDQLDEKWSQKYKDSINCSNPKGFSQKAHCQGKNK